MIKVYTSSVIDAPADAVWAVIRDFNGLPRWTPFVAESRIEAGLPADKVGPLARYAAAIQSQRGDYNGKVLSIRAEDLRSLAIIYDTSPGELTDQLIDWGVLPPDARPAGRD